MRSPRPFARCSPRTAETVATFVLIHGAGDVGWYWHLVEAELRTRGHDAVAPDLPCDDDSAGLSEYADASSRRSATRRSDRGGAVLRWFHGAVRLRSDRGGPPRAGRPDDPVARPGPERVLGEHGYQQEGGTTPEDPIALFYHDVPPELASEALTRGAHSPKHESTSHAPRGVAGRAHADPPVSLRRSLPGHVHPPGRPRAPGHHTGRDRRRPLRRAQSPDRAGRRLESYLVAIHERP